jgi:4-amino-4-deoxy-L-arabinose transferase-like glycosyltransferase
LFNFSKKFFIQPPTSNYFYLFSFTLLTLVLAAFTIPLTDRTEGRYAEIARKMVETGDWVTLYHDYGIPFWGKPPLSTWLSATGMSFFGTNAFAARLPIILVAMVVIWIVMNLANTRRQEDLSKISALILFTSGLFYLASAAVMTDMVLTLGTTLSMVAYWHAVKEDGSPAWKYLFFVGISIGLLAKGPLTLILVGFPIFVWGFSKLGFRELWYKFPWIKGAILTTAIVAPWYILAEIKTPGFLNYFLLGEHFNRFFVKGWSGDLYGFAHNKPLGFIWIFWVVDTLPWSLWFIGILIANIRKGRKILVKDDGWLFYITLWALSPLLIFTMAKNIILTYTLPGIPAFALLLGHFLVGSIKESIWMKRAFFASTLVAPGLALVFITLSYSQPSSVNSEKYLVEAFMKDHTDPNNKLIYFDSHAYSAMFYSEGSVSLIGDLNQLVQKLEEDGDFFLVLRKERKLKLLPQELQENLQEIQKYNNAIIYKKIKSR